MKGKFIVIEGGDGAGKDTQIELLKKELGEGKFLFVKDPGSTDVGLKLREIVLYGDAVAEKTELLLYLAARVQLAEEKIVPALKEGIHVISNRFDLSTIAYQIYGRKRQDMKEFVEGLSSFALSEAKPDFVVYLDCPVDIGLRRVLKSGEAVDKFENEKLDFHKRVREGYAEALKQYDHTVIDATLPVDRVFVQVVRAVREIVPDQNRA